MKEKTSRLHNRKQKFLILLAPFAVLVSALLFSSCAQMGSIMQGAASLGSAFGLIDPSTANMLQKSGVAAEAWGKAFEQITPEQEYFIGRAVGANILASYKIQTTTPAMTSYVNKICNALVIHSTRPEIFNGYHMAILDSDEINAFATPGGHIFMTRGLINCATSEDTLAAVIAHEISHIQLQHGLKAIKNNRGTQAVMTTLSAGVSVAASGLEIAEVLDTFTGSINDMVSTMVTKGYSRSQEYDADSVAMSLLALAGYEPSSLLDMLRVLEKEQAGHKGGFNNTHPTPAQRITNANKTVKNYSVTDTRTYRASRFAAAK